MIGSCWLTDREEQSGREKVRERDDGNVIKGCGEFMLYSKILPGQGVGKGREGRWGCLSWRKALFSRLLAFLEIFPELFS